jgi:hypothetical protein
MPGNTVMNICIQGKVQSSSLIWEEYPGRHAREHHDEQRQELEVAGQYTSTLHHIQAVKVKPYIFFVFSIMGKACVHKNNREKKTV